MPLRPGRSECRGKRAACGNPDLIGWLIGDKVSLDHDSRGARRPSGFLWRVARIREG